MFKDIILSEELTAEFKSSPFGRITEIELNVKVLTAGNWPNEQKDQLLSYLPRELTDSMT